MKFLRCYLHDRCWFLLIYCAGLAMNLLTYFLHEIPWVIYADQVLFSFSILGIASLIDGWFYYRKYHALQTGQKFPKRYAQLPVKTQNLLFQEYEALIRKLAQTDQAALQQLETKNQELINYYGMWTHQIKTPLAVLHLKMQENQLDAAVMKQELFKIDQYLDMMLQYMRLNHTELDFMFERVDLDQLLKETIKKYATFFIHKELKLNLTPTKEILITDAKWFQFVLEQVIFNAIKYTQKGQINIYLNDQKQLVIEDTGIGILPEDVARVFEYGYTGLNGHRQQKASGLGLYMSRQIIEKLGYRLFLTSEVGVGTKVFLDLKQKNYSFQE